jgi:hypothetical protein
MVTPDKPAIRNVLATPAGRAGEQWVCQSIALGADDSILGQNENEPNGHYREKLPVPIDYNVRARLLALAPCSTSFFSEVL